MYIFLVNLIHKNTNKGGIGDVIVILLHL